MHRPTRLLLLLLPVAVACEGVILEEGPPVAGPDGSVSAPPATDGSVPDPSDAPPGDEPPGDEPPGDDPPGDDPPGDDPPGSTDGVVPDTAHCEPVASFGASVTAAEDEILRLTNQHRAAGADCGTEGTFGPTDPLTMKPTLRCAARLHSLDMDERDYFAHTNPDGDSPGDRIEAAGYGAWSTWGENISGRSGGPATVVQGWMNSDGHCANIMSPNFTEIGVGIVANLSTQKFARPR
jgi:uncharacterized protein YkwD